MLSTSSTDDGRCWQWLLGFQSRSTADDDAVRVSRHEQYTVRRLHLSAFNVAAMSCTAGQGRGRLPTPELAQPLPPNRYQIGDDMIQASQDSLIHD